MYGTGVVANQTNLNQTANPNLFISENDRLERDCKHQISTTIIYLLGSRRIPNGSFNNPQQVLWSLSQVDATIWFRVNGRKAFVL